MRKLLVQFLILTLLSSNSYAGPLIDRNRPDIGPDIRPGQRGSIAQNAMGSNHDQYSILNSGSNQSILMRNNILLQQQNLNNTNPNNYLSFNPQISLPNNGARLPLGVVAKHSLETNGGHALANRVAPSPFASKVAKSQTQGAIFISSTNLFANGKDAMSSESFHAGLGFAVEAIMGFKQHKNDPTHVPIGTPIGLVFVAAALLYLPSILNYVGSAMFGGSSSQMPGPVKDTFINDISAEMVQGGVPPQEAQKISQALIAMWTIAISSGVRNIPSDTRNEIAAYFTDSCATCTSQMIDAAMKKSEQLVMRNSALRLDQTLLKEVAVKINTAVKNTDQDGLDSEGSKLIFIKKLQGKTITL